MEPIITNLWVSRPSCARRDDLGLHKEDAAEECVRKDRRALLPEKICPKEARNQLSKTRQIYGGFACNYVGSCWWRVLFELNEHE